MFIDPDGAYPWPVQVRSFISSNKTGGFFRGDGRGANTKRNTKGNTSRVRTAFTVDPSAGTVSNPVATSDPTVLYLGEIVAGKEGRQLGADVVKTGSPSASITNLETGDGSVSFDFSHEGKDPITPGFATPDLDVNARLSITEDLDNGLLTIAGAFTGDSFPSAEALITDQGGNNLLLGAFMEDGGLHSLVGEGSNALFNVNMQVSFDSDGNFTGVTSGDKTYSVSEWNKYVSDNF